MASRLVKERLHGDVLIMLPDAVPWLASIDSAALYTSEQLLTIARRHSPAVSGLGSSRPQSPEPPIKALLNNILSSAFLPEFMAQHDHANCGDSCRHLAYLPRHPALSFKPRKRTTAMSTAPPAPPAAPEDTPGSYSSLWAPVSAERSKQDAQMDETSFAPSSLCAAIPTTPLVRTLSDESTTTTISTATLDVTNPLLGLPSSALSLQHAPKRASVDTYSYSITGVHLCASPWPCMRMALPWRRGCMRLHVACACDIGHACVAPSVITCESSARCMATKRTVAMLCPAAHTCALYSCYTIQV